jgi:large subunit ribosomal protein L18
MLAQIDRKSLRRRVRHRVRRKIAGTAERPRLAVYRSGRHIYVQAIDDAAGRTVAHASTQDPELRQQAAKGWNVEAASLVGKKIAERLQSGGVQQACSRRCSTAAAGSTGVGSGRWPRRPAKRD